MKKVSILLALSAIFFVGCTSSNQVSNPCEVVDNKIASLKADRKAGKIGKQEEYFGKRELHDKYPECKITF